jgi:hypothetical protein
VRASDRIIMGTEEPALLRLWHDRLRLWHEKRGEAEPKDLTTKLIVQLGPATEDLSRADTGLVVALPSKSAAETSAAMPRGSRER